MRVVLGHNRCGYFIAEERGDGIGKYLSDDGKWTQHMKVDGLLDGGTYYSTCEEAMHRAFTHKCEIVRELVLPLPSGVSTPTQDNDTRTLKQLAANAIMVQDACNLIAVVKSFDRDLRRLKALLNLDGDSVRIHPIAVLYADKIADMTGRGDTYSSAWDECTNLANQA